MTIVTALLGISVACYLFGVLYSPWGKDYRTERQTAAAPPADEVWPTLVDYPGLARMPLQIAFHGKDLQLWQEGHSRQACAAVELAFQGLLGYHSLLRQTRADEVAWQGAMVATRLVVLQEDPGLELADVKSTADPARGSHQLAEELQ